jgi:hypothetical protein
VDLDRDAERAVRLRVPDCAEGSGQGELKLASEPPKRAYLLLAISRTRQSEKPRAGRFLRFSIAAATTSASCTVRCSWLRSISIAVAICATAHIPHRAPTSFPLRPGAKPTRHLL